jgi:hypothetical protein
MILAACVWSRKARPVGVWFLAVDWLPKVLTQKGDFLGFEFYRSRGSFATVPAMESRIDPALRRPPAGSALRLSLCRIRLPRFVGDPFGESERISGFAQLLWIFYY